MITWQGRKILGFHLTLPTGNAGRGNFILLLLLVAFGLNGCKPKDHTTDKLSGQAEPALITGQVFIENPSSENLALGDTKVALLNAYATRDYFNSKAAEWSNSLVAAQSKVDLATTNYNDLDKDEIAKLKSAKKYHDDKLKTASAGSQEWEDAFGWSQKLSREIRDVNRSRKASAAKKALDAAVDAQSLLWDEINWPSADDFWPRIAATTTDSGGRFKFVVPHSAAGSNMLILAKALRQIDGTQTNFWWLVNVNLDTGKSTEFILSNDNRDASGIWSWFGPKQTNIITSENFEKSQNDEMNDPMVKFMLDYMVKLAAAKHDRDYQDWLDSLDD